MEGANIEGRERVCSVACQHDALAQMLRRARRVRLDTSSLSKYASVVREVGDWDWLQRLLAALSGVARRHGVSVADVAQRWVLERPQARRGGRSRMRQGLRTGQHRRQRCSGCVTRRRSRRCHPALRPAASPRA